MSKNQVNVDETSASQTEPSVCDSNDNGTDSESVEKAGEGVDQLIANINQLIDEDCAESETKIANVEKLDVAECPKSLDQKKPSGDVKVVMTKDMDILIAMQGESVRTGDKSKKVAASNKAVQHEPSTSSKSLDTDKKGSPVVVLTRLAAGISSMKVEKSSVVGTKLSSKQMTKKEKWHDDASLSDLSVSDISLSDSEEIVQTVKQDKKKAAEKLQGRAESGKIRTNKGASNVSSSASKKNEKSTDYSVSKRHTQGDRGSSSDVVNALRKDKHEKESGKSSSSKEMKQTDGVKPGTKADERQGDTKIGKNKRRSVDTPCSDEKRAKVENMELFKLIPKPDLVEKVNPRSSSNMKYQLSLSPIRLSDLSNPAFRKFINLASDCAVDFSKKINATGLQNGSVNLYFGDFVAIQSAMHKLCQLPILANGYTICGIIKCIEILPKARKEQNGENWSKNLYGKLFFNFYSDKAEPLQQLIQLKDRKRAGMKKENAHVHRIPVSLSRDMLSLLFPFSVGVKYLDTAEATQKFYRGPVEIEFESREWMEAVLTCFQNTAFLPGTRTAKTFHLIIRNFSAPIETTRAHQSSASSRDSPFSESNRQQGSSYKSRERGRSAERDKSSRSDQRKRPFADSRSGSNTAGRSSEKQMRINLAPESRPGIQQRPNHPALNTNVEAVRRAALARGLDGSNQDVRRLLEMQGQLETVQSMVLQQTLEANSLGIACSPAQRALAMGQSQEVLARLNHARQQVMQAQDAQQRMGLGVGAEQSQLLEELRRRKVQEREVQGGYQSTQKEIMIKEGIAQQQQRRLEELEQQMRQSQLAALQSGEGQRGVKEAQARGGYVGLPRTEGSVRPFGNASSQNGLLGAGPGMATDTSISEAILAAQQRQAQYVLKQAAGHTLPDAQRSSLDQRQGSNVSSQSRSRQTATAIGITGIPSRNESGRSSGSTHGHSAEIERANAQRRQQYGNTSQLDIRGSETAARAQHDNRMRLNEGRKPRSLEKQDSSRRDKQPQEHRVKRKTRWSDAGVGQAEVAARISGTKSMDPALNDKPLDRSRRSAGMDHSARAGFQDQRDKSRVQSRILDDTELCLPVQFGKHAVKKTPAQIIKEKVMYEALELQKRQFSGQSNFEDRSQKDKALVPGLGGQFSYMGGGRDAERGRANRGRDGEMDRANRGSAEMVGAYGSRNNEMVGASRATGDGMGRRRERDDNIGWSNRGRAPERDTQSSATSYHGFTGGVQNLKEDVGFYALPHVERVSGALDGSQQHSLDTDYGGKRSWAESSNQPWLGAREISQGKVHGKRGPIQTMDDEEYESGWQMSGQSFTGVRKVARPGQYDSVPESKEAFKHGWQQERNTAQSRSHPLDAVQGGYAKKALYPSDDDYDQQQQWTESEENRFPYSENKTRGIMPQAAQRFSPVRLGAIPAKGGGKSTRERQQPVEHPGDWVHGNFKKDQGFPYQGVKSNPAPRVMGSGNGRDEFHEYGEEEGAQNWAGWSEEENYGPSHLARGMDNKQLGAPRARNEGIGRGMQGQRDLQGGKGFQRGDFQAETDYQDFEGGNFDMGRQGQNLWPKVRSGEAPGAGLLGRGGAHVFSQSGRGQHQAGYSQGGEESFGQQYFPPERQGRQAGGLLYSSDIQTGGGVNFY